MPRRAAGRAARRVVGLAAFVSDPLCVPLESGLAAWRRSADRTRARVRVRIDADGRVVAREVLPPVVPRR